MGIRIKISFGFAMLALLLLFSGTVSVIELGRLRRASVEIKGSDSGSSELSGKMLRAVAEQNNSLLRSIALGSKGYDTAAYTAARSDFEEALRELYEISPDRSRVDDIRSAKANFDSIVSGYMEDPENTDVQWFLDTYDASHRLLITAIENETEESHLAGLDKISRLEESAYRTITPIALSICIAILFIMVFAFLLDYYFTRPVIRITEGLEKHIRYDLPFDVKVESSDEIERLRDAVDDLVSSAKNK